jgi:hypothetical protein
MSIFNDIRPDLLCYNWTVVGSRRLITEAGKYFGRDAVVEERSWERASPGAKPPGGNDSPSGSAKLPSDFCAVQSAFDGLESRDTPYLPQRLLLWGRYGNFPAR